MKAYLLKSLVFIPSLFLIKSYCNQTNHNIIGSSSKCNILIVENKTIENFKVTTNLDVSQQQLIFTPPQSSVNNFIVNVVDCGPTEPISANNNIKSKLKNIN